jgi:hypothetical protein
LHTTRDYLRFSLHVTRREKWKKEKGKGWKEDGNERLWREREDNDSPSLFPCCDFHSRDSGERDDDDGRKEGNWE